MWIPNIERINNKDLVNLKNHNPDPVYITIRIQGPKNHYLQSEDAPLIPARCFCFRATTENIDNMTTNPEFTVPPELQVKDQRGAYSGGDYFASPCGARRYLDYFRNLDYAPVRDDKN